MQDALITLTGNVGTDVEFTRGEGWQLARFRLACTPRRIRQGEWVDMETTWIGVTAWGRTAENIKTSLAKGDPVVVHGKLRTSAWHDQAGIRHERLVVEATALGHDLTRGRSEFIRTERRAPQVVTDEDGNLVNAVTGEILEQAPPSEVEEAPREEQLTHS